MLFEIEGLRGAEIAAATGTKLNTVFTRLKAARKRFNEYLRIRRQDEPLQARVEEVA